MYARHTLAVRKEGSLDKGILRPGRARLDGRGCYENLRARMDSVAFWLSIYIVRVFMHSLPRATMVVRRSRKQTPQDLDLTIFR